MANVGLTWRINIKKLMVLAFALMGFAPNARAASCLYLVEAHVTSKKLTFLSDIVELPYPAGSKHCSHDSAGNYLRREQKLEEQFLSFIKSRNPGLENSNIDDIKAKWYSNENEARFIQQMTKTLAASGQPDARGNRIVLLSGRFYSE